MLTKVRLDGVMGKKFGKDWELDVSTPAEALRLIEANSPGLKRWIVENTTTYDAYRVTCVYDDDREEDLNDDTYGVTRANLKEIRFTPTVTGSGGIVKVVVGVVLIIAGTVWTQPWMVQMGAMMVLGGVIELLTFTPKKDSQDDSFSSFYFDGPTNTERQGAPVPLIYGRVLVGSHPISAAISIDEMPA